MILFLLFSFLPVFCLSSQELFEQGRYKELVELYQENSPTQPLELYQAGVAAYRLEMRAHAFLWWRRAQKLWGLFNAYTVQEAIDIAKRRKRSTADTMFLMLRMFFVYSPLWFWQLLVLLILLFLASGTRINRSTTILVYILLSGASLWVGLRYAYLQTPYAIVMKQAEFHSGPANHFSVMGSMSPARRVRVLEEKETQDGLFYRVAHSSGARGWVNADAVTVI